jgi:beta-ureidopropionase
MEIHASKLKFISVISIYLFIKSFNITNSKLEIPKEAKEFSDLNDFDLQAYSIAANPEQTRPKRLVRIGAIQNKIVLPTTEPVAKQRDAIHKRIGQLIQAASWLKVNVLCLQEAWTMPFAFCTREKQPWCEFAEDAYEGPTTKFLSEVYYLKKLKEKLDSTFD